MTRTALRIFRPCFGILGLLSFSLAHAAEPIFTNVTATVAPGLPEVEYSSVAWADYDGDGRKDFLLTGFSYYGTNRYLGQLWRNTENGFVDVTATAAPGLPPLYSGSVAWGDYDNDGRPDFLFAGYSTNGPISQIWRNTESGFTNVTANVAPGLPGVAYSSVAWGDYDNDGRLDFLIAGYAGYSAQGKAARFSQVWRNTENGFSNVTVRVAPELPAVMYATVAWGDYDNDGRLDFLIAGADGFSCEECDTPRAYSQLWRNTGDGFANVTASVVPGLPTTYYTTAAWGDFDNDGRLDFLLGSRLWRNTGTRFTNVTSVLAPNLAYAGSAAWGDYDNDGRLDFLISGYLFSQIWRNTGNGFSNVTATIAPGLPGVVFSSLAWADYDNDGRLDFLLTGSRFSHCDGCDQYGAVAQVWRNTSAPTNPPPSILTGLPHSATPTGVALTARINPRGTDANAWFAWGTSTNLGFVTAAQAIGNGSLLTDFSQTISGLSTGATYYYRAVGSNAQGQVTIGAEQRFTLAPPGVNTGTAGNPSTLNARALPNNLPAAGWFEWGPTPVYGEVTPIQFLGQGFTADFGANLPELQFGTTYFYRAVASNSLGLAYGSALSFIASEANVICPGFIIPNSRSHGSSTAANTVMVFLGCVGQVVNTNTWITITSPTNGLWTGGGSLAYTVAANNDPQARSGYIVIGGHRFNVFQAGGHAALTLQPPAQNVPAGGTAAFQVSVAGTPPFTYLWQFNGVTLADGNGIDGATTSNLVLTGVQFAQAGFYRVIVGNAAGATVGFSSSASLTVTCDYTLLTNQAAFGSLSVTGQVTVQTPATDCPWNIVNTNAWVTILSGIVNEGSDTITYVLADNPTETARSGNLLIAGKAFAITQAAGSPPNDFLRLEHALDIEGLYSLSTVGTPAWFGQTLVAQDGVDAAQSGPLNHDEAVTVQATVTGPGTISFWWKVSSETNRDVLKFFINGGQVTRISGEQDWQQLSFPVPAGITVLKWTYSKNNSGTAGQDRGWLDQVTFVPSNPCNLALSPASSTHHSGSSTGFLSVITSPGCSWTAINTNSWVEIAFDNSGSGSAYLVYQLTENSGPPRSGNLVVAGQLFTITQLAPATNPTIPLAEALDTTHAALAWDTIGAPDWFGQSLVSHDGVDAAQSGAVAHGSAVTLQTAAQGPGALSFWWKVSSELDKDYLKFFIDGVQQARISGVEDWESQRYLVPAGNHIFKWTYSKNAFGSAGLDRGWVDQVRFASNSGPCLIAFSHTSATHFSNSATGQIDITTTTGCPWEVINTNAWIAHTVGVSDSGNGYVRYTLPANNSTSERLGVITIAGEPITIRQLPRTVPCTFATSPSSQEHEYFASTASFAVSAPTGCGWNPFTSDPWITISPSSRRSGNGQVVYTVSENPSRTRRSGQISVEGNTFSVSQAGTPIPIDEALDVEPNAFAWVFGGGWFGQSDLSYDGVDALTTRPGYNRVTTTITGPGRLTFWWKASSGNALGLLFYANFSIQATLSGQTTWQQQTIHFPSGIHNIGWVSDGVTGWLDQLQFIPTAGCPVTLAPGQAAHISGVSTGFVTVAAAAECAWTVFNTNAWISIGSARNGTGDGSVTYTLSANPLTLARQGHLRIGDQVFLVTQNAAPTNPPSGCPLSILPNSRSHGSGSSTNQISVTAQAGCWWNVFTTNAWITVVSPGSSNSGNGQVIYSVAANPTPFGRVGSLRMGNLVFIVSQVASSNQVYISLPEALDSGPLAWTTGGTVPWSGQIEVNHDGEDAARSGAVSHGDSSYLETIVQGPGSISYWWKVSSETGHDGLSFSIDGVQALKLEGEVNWNQRTASIPAGSHLLRWAYTKDATGSSGQDCGWLDQVLYLSTIPCAYTLSSTNALHGGGSSTGLVSITTTAGCNWSVVETNHWISIGPGVSGTGNGLVRYVLTVNTSTVPRLAVITIAGQPFTIHQAAGGQLIRLQNMAPGAAPVLSVDGPAGRHFVIESSEDFIHWTPLGTNSAPDLFRDAANTNAVRRFYRSYELP